MPCEEPRAEIDRIDLRLPHEMKERIAQLAAQENRSINAQLVVLLREALNRSHIKRES